MNMHSLRVLSGSALRLLPVFVLGAFAHAANSRWTGAIDGDWTNAGNWTAGVPGLPSPETTSPDTAAFDVSANTAVVVDVGRNLFGLTFDNTAAVAGVGASAFSVSGGPLVFRAPPGLPTIQVQGMFGLNPETVSAPVVITGSVGGNDLIVGTSNGYGSVLTLSGGISSGAASGTSQLTLRTGLGGPIIFSGNISNGTGTNVVSINLATSNNGTVILTGANTSSGNMIVGNGRLVLDYSTNATVAASNQAVVIGGGTFVIQGSASGTTAQTLDAPTGNDLALSTSTGGTLVVDKHGGAGTTLTLGNTWSRGSASTLLIDLSSGGTLVSSPAMTNGIVTASSAAGFFVKDATGTGFATVNGGSVVRFMDAVPLTDTGGATLNLKTSGFTLSGTTNFSTLELDASNAGDSRVLDLGANNLTPAGGLAFLVTGGNDFTITGTTGTINNNSVLYHAGTGTLHVQVGIVGGITKAGPGLAVFEQNATSNFTLQGGVTRFIGTSTITSANVLISSGAVLELGTDMDAGSAADFTRGLSTTAGGVQIIGSGGFSAFGGDRIVNLGGLSATVSWGSAAGSNLLNGVFILSSEYSDSMVEFQNGINLSGFDRAIRVNNGSADVDARISGAIVGTNNGLYKSGNGTLELSADNTYSGNTRIDAGRVLLSGSLFATSAIIVGNGATLELGGPERLSDFAKVRLEGGTLKTGGFSEFLGTLNLVGNSTIDLGNGSSFLQFADSSAIEWSGGLSILNWTGLATGNGTDAIFFGFSDTALTPAQVGLIQFVDPAGFAPGTYDAQILASGEIVAIPEPGTGAAWWLGASVLLGLARMRKPLLRGRLSGLEA